MKKKSLFRYIIPVLFFCLVVGFAVYRSLRNSDEEIYGGHGFKYMNGYSSTDFTGYHVYDGEKLYTLDHEASLRIENEEDMPVLDGAEALYPVYSALAKAVYADIDQIENKNRNVRQTNGKIVTFTNSVYGYNRLINGETDLFFGARPAESQKEYASELQRQISTLVIGREAFVFFTEKDNPVDSLTVDQLRAIYHGDIVNWSEVGGKDQEILAFQRPEESGSQVMMRYFMGDVSLKEPMTYETYSSMTGVIQNVKQYHNEKGALGYTFRYFLEGLQQEKDVKILKVDGIEPSIDNIADGSYPIIVDVVCAYLDSNPKPSVKKMLEFLLTDDAQEIIEGTGYGSLKDRTPKIRTENDLPPMPSAEYICPEDPDRRVIMYWGDGEEDPWLFHLRTSRRDYTGFIYRQEEDDLLHCTSYADGQAVFYLEGSKDGYRVMKTEYDSDLHMLEEGYTLVPVQ